jgi:WD40 repeat protein
MGAGVSHEEAEKYLDRQEQLIEKLTAAVAARKKEQSGAADSGALGGSAPAWLVAQQNRFGTEDAVSPTAAAPEIPTALYDEFYGLLERARAAERRRIEPVVEAYELELPNAEWTAPTEEQAAALRDSRPWLAVMNKPEGFEYGTTDAKPALTLELEHVYGYRSSGTRNNLRWTTSSSNGQGLLFCAGAVAVVHDVTSNTQTFFQEHQDEITALTVSKDGNLAATGDQGKYPCVYIWDVETKKVRAKLTGTLRRAAASLAFSDDGQLIAAVGLDDDNSVVIYDWRRGRVVAEAATGNRRILEVVSNTEASTKDAYPFLIIGEGGLAEWWGFDTKSFTNNQRPLVKAPLQLGSIGAVQTLTSARSTPEFTAIGTDNGELYIARGFQLQRIVDAHHGPVLSIAANASFSVLATGGYDGYVSQWGVENGFRRLSSTVIPTSAVSSAGSSSEDTAAKTFSRPNSIRSVDVLTNAISGAVEALLVGTVSGGVYQVEPRPRGTSDVITPLLVAHGGDLSTVNCVGELTGLAAHPTESKFVSVGETTLFLWDTSTRTALKKYRLPARGQCVAWGSNGHIVVGLHNGVFLVLSSTLELIKEVRASNRRVQCLRFSGDGTVLAVGTADNVIQLYDASSSAFDFGGKLAGCGGVPLSIDFSADGKLIQVSDQMYETIYFDIRNMVVLNDADARVASNVAWVTFSSLLGWSVQGIWPQGSELNDVTSVSRSASGTVLATAEESGLVKLFQFPCVGGGIDYNDGLLHKRPDSVRGGGHGGKVTQVQWLNNDSTLISAGGEDLSCFQWKVVRKA